VMRSVPCGPLVCAQKSRVAPKLELLFQAYAAVGARFVQAEAAAAVTNATSTVPHANKTSASRIREAIKAESFLDRFFMGHGVGESHF